jgi:2-methylisocitrate lyase-like PEP mutase family enzyme
MSSNEHRRRCEQLLSLHRGSLLILPNAWDAFSAVLMEAVGFKAIATTSAGVSWSLGYADGEKIPWHDMLAAVERIVDAVKVPVTADIESGFSSTASDLIYRIEEVIGVGACGVNLEDGVGPTHQPRPLEEACERIAAARQAATKLSVPLVINARTDIYLNAGNNDPSLLEPALTRAKAYIAAGADCVYPLGLLDIEQIKRFVAELKHPVNIIGRRGTPAISALQAAGVARVSTATTPAVFVAGVLSDAMTKLIQSGSFDHFASSFDYPKLQNLFPPRV